MQQITIFLVIASSTLVFCVGPVYELCIYIAALVWYPSYLTIPIGTVDFTLGRIVILSLFVNIFLRTDLARRFKFIMLDKLVLAYFVCTILAGAIVEQASQSFFIYKAGEFFEVVMTYFAVRMIITTKAQYITLLKAILLISAPLAILGLYQCLTGNNPMGFLTKYNAWSEKSRYFGYRPENRLGFFRATVSFDVSIMFGLFFAMLGPVCAGLMRSVIKNREKYMLGLGLMMVGVFSSMSSGPLLATMVAVLFLAFYRYRKYWKVALGIIVLICVLVEIISNRHFYQVIDRITFSSSTAWYRAKLLQVAIYDNGMAGHWLIGFGFADPGWGAKLDMRDKTDMVNHYLLVLCRYGLVGFVPFMAVIVTAWKQLFKNFWVIRDDSDRWLAWCLGGALFGLLVSLFSVSLFGPPATFFFVLMGLCGSLGLIINTKNVLPLKEIGRDFKGQCSMRGKTAYDIVPGRIH